MCKLYGLLANQPTKVECCLIRAQDALMKRSRGDSHGRQHANGWGVVCYDAQDRSRIPTTVRHSNCAFDSDHFSRSAQKVYSKATVAHVRLATVGFTSTLNAHPFVHDEWTFAHNGTIPSFETVSKRMESSMEERYLNCRLGTTDSELLFLWLLNRLKSGGITSDNVAQEQESARDILATALASLVQDCREIAPQEIPSLNFVLTNGHVLFACRWNNPLYRLVRSGIADGGESDIQHQGEQDYRAVVVASEPITEESWQELPNYSLMYVGPDLTCTIDEIPHDNLVGN